MPTPRPPRRLTTATTHDPLSAPGERWLPAVLLAGYAALWTAAAVSPASRDGWLLENVLPLSILALLGGMYRRWHLSDASHLCVAVFLALPAAGAHYAYTDVSLASGCAPCSAARAAATRTTAPSTSPSASAGSTPPARRSSIT